ncbi:MAG: YkgJ family cysteine cluster protein [Candidatus Latescibacterota bacterium]
MELEPKWYESGLRFTCTQCGNCCTGAPGTVKVSNEEISALASRLGMSKRAFRGAYTRRVNGFTSLREKANYDCIFFDKRKGCTVYEHRPRQCRTWPFWRGLVDTRERWDEEALECPGMNQGELHSAEMIELTILRDGTSTDRSK